MGGTSDAWGRSWALSELTAANFKVRVICNSTDSGRDFYLDSIPVRITYADTYRWRLSGGGFQGQGDPSALTCPERTLTMTDGVDLSEYPSGSVGVSWDQNESGTLEFGDQLKFAFSGDDGVTWSRPDGDGYEAFHDDINNGPEHFTFDVPDDVLDQPLQDALLL